MKIIVDTRLIKLVSKYILYMYINSNIGFNRTVFERYDVDGSRTNTPLTNTPGIIPPDKYLLDNNPRAKYPFDILCNMFIICIEI